MSKPIPLSAVQVRVLAGVSLADERTIRKVYGGQETKSSPYARVAAAARQLGFPDPPPHVSAVVRRRRDAQLERMHSPSRMFAATCSTGRRSE